MSEGTWQFSDGTSQFAGIKGGGTFKVRHHLANGSGMHLARPLRASCRR
jgi:hypothetical protein